MKRQFQEITGLPSICSFQKLQHQPRATEGHSLHTSFLRLHFPAIELFEISHNLCLNMSKKEKKVMLCLNSFSLMGQSKKTVFACFVTRRQNSFSKSVSAEGWERNCTPHYWFSKLQCLRFSHNCKSSCSFCDFCEKIAMSFEKLLFILRYFCEGNVWQKCLVGDSMNLTTERCYRNWLW